MKNLGTWTAETRKFLVAFAGALAQLVSIGVLQGQALLWAQAILGVLTALGVYAVPNAKRTVEAPKATPAYPNGLYLENNADEAADGWAGHSYRAE